MAIQLWSHPQNLTWWEGTKGHWLGHQHWALATELPGMCHIWCMFRVPGSYIIMCETVRFVRCGDCCLFTQMKHHRYSWFSSLVFMGWCLWGKCSLKVPDWLVFLSVFLYLYGLMNKKSVQNMLLTLTSFLMFFLLTFQLWSKATCIEVNENQIKDLALFKFLSRHGQGYYLYLENLRHAKSWVSYTECHYFWGETLHLQVT